MTIPCCTYLMHFSFILHDCMASLNGWLPLSQWKRFFDSLNNHLWISVGSKCLLFTLPGFIYIVFTLLDFMLLSSFLYTRKVVSDRVSNMLYEEKVRYLVIKKVLYFFSFFHSRKFVSYRVQKSCITVWTLESDFYVVAFGNLTKSMTVESSQMTRGICRLHNLKEREKKSYFIIHSFVCRHITRTYKDA